MSACPFNTGFKLFKFLYSSAGHPPFLLNSKFLVNEELLIVKVTEPWSLISAFVYNNSIPEPAEFCNDILFSNLFFDRFILSMKPNRMFLAKIPKP